MAGIFLAIMTLEPEVNKRVVNACCQTDNRKVADSNKKNELAEVHG